MAVMKSLGNTSYGGSSVNNIGAGLDPDVELQASMQLEGQRRNNIHQRERDAAQHGYQRDLFQAQADAEAARQAAQLGFQREQLGAQTGLEQQRLAQQALAMQQKEGWRQQVFGQIQNVLKGINDWRSGYQGRGPVGQPTPISSAPVYDENTINQRVNAMRASTDASVAAQNQKVANQMAARGFGTKSPLAMALQRGAFLGGLQGNTAAEENLRWAAAQGNAEHVLNAQKLMEQQRANLNQEDIERGKVSLGALTSALGSLGGLFS
jgi:hypothetical protein